MSSLITNFLEPFSYFIYTGLFVSIVGADKSLKKIALLFYYLFASVIIFYACLLAHFITWGDNNWLYNLFFLVTIVVLSYYFHEALDNSEKKTTVKIILLVNIILFAWYDIILKKFDFNYNNYVVACCFLSIVIYSLLYFHQLINNVSDRNILHEFDFWLVTGYLLYFLGAFFVILFYKNASVTQRAFLWGLQNLILFSSAMITLSGNIWMRYRKKLV